MTIKRTKEEVIHIIREARKKNEWADLSGSDLQGMDLRDTGLCRDDLTGANLRGTNLLGMDLSSAKLQGADLREANLRWTNFRSLDIGLFFPADLSKSNLSNAILFFANLSKANLTDAILNKARITGANLSEADLARADLSEANLRKADLRKANLTGANLRHADLQEANLTGVNLEGANLTDAHIGYAIFGDVDLSLAEGLDSVNHNGRNSIIDVNTLYKSKGNIPLQFLEKVGVPEAIIKWHTNLKNLPLVFICSSHKDKEEKDKLVTQLQVIGQQGFFTIWDYDDQVLAGSEWKQKIEDGLNRAKIALLLVSADLLTSKHFSQLELPILLERKRRQGNDFTIFPVIAKNCAWQEVDWLKRFDVRPKGGDPIWSNDGVVDAKLAEIATEVKISLERL